MTKTQWYGLLLLTLAPMLMWIAGLHMFALALAVFNIVSFAILFILTRKA